MLFSPSLSTTSAFHSSPSNRVVQPPQVSTTSSGSSLIARVDEIKDVVLKDFRNDPLEVPILAPRTKFIITGTLLARLNTFPINNSSENRLTLAQEITDHFELYQNPDEGFKFPPSQFLCKQTSNESDGGVVTSVIALKSDQTVTSIGFKIETCFKNGGKTGGTRTSVEGRVCKAFWHFKLFKTSLVDYLLVEGSSHMAQLKRAGSVPFVPWEKEAPWYQAKILPLLQQSNEKENRQDTAPLSSPGQVKRQLPKQEEDLESPPFKKHHGAGSSPIVINDDESGEDAGLDSSLFFSTPAAARALYSPPSIQSEESSERGAILSPSSSRASGSEEQEDHVSLIETAIRVQSQFPAFLEDCSRLVKGYKELATQQNNQWLKKIQQLEQQLSEKDVLIQQKEEAQSEWIEKEKAWTAQNHEQTQQILQLTGELTQTRAHLESIEREISGLDLDSILE